MGAVRVGGLRGEGEKEKVVLDVLSERWSWSWMFL